MLKRKNIQSYFMFLNIFRLFSYYNIVNSFIDVSHSIYFPGVNPFTKDSFFIINKNKSPHNEVKTFVYLG